MRRSILFLLFASGLSFGQTRSAVQSLAHSCIPQADPLTVLSVVEVESHFRGWALSVNYPARTSRQLGFPSGEIYLQRKARTREEALSWIGWFQQSQMTMSIGLMQVNTEEARRFGVAPEQLLNPCLNLQLGWRIFCDHYARARQKYGEGQRALHAAISAYNSGSFAAGFTNGYVGKVLRATGR
jgi:type IV secretion system protein VirB1